MYLFKKFMLNEDGRRTATKTGLYALGYGGLGLYCPSDYLTHSADAILYLTQDERLYQNGDQAPFDISHLPGHKLYGDKVNNGDKEPHDITHLPGESIPPKPSPLPGAPNLSGFKTFYGMVAPKGAEKLPGKIVSPKSVAKTKWQQPGIYKPPFYNK